MSMSLRSRQEYVTQMYERYARARTRQQKTQLIDELVQTAGYHRKYAVRLLSGPLPATQKRPKQRIRQRKYLEILPVVQLVWEALDYPCAERLHPALLSTAEQFAAHNELLLTPAICQQPGHFGTALGRDVLTQGAPHDGAHESAWTASLRDPSRSLPLG